MSEGTKLQIYIGIAGTMLAGIALFGKHNPSSASTSTPLPEPSGYIASASPGAGGFSGGGSADGAPGRPANPPSVFEGEPTPPTTPPGHPGHEPPTTTPGHPQHEHVEPKPPTTGEQAHKATGARNWIPFPRPKATPPIHA